MGGWLGRLDRFCVVSTQRVAFVGVVAMLFIAFTTITDVLLRWLANSPIDGLPEIEGMALAVAVSGCFPAGAAQRDPIGFHHMGLLAQRLQNQPACADCHFAKRTGFDSGHKPNQANVRFRARHELSRYSVWLFVSRRRFLLATI